ncbi:MAG: SDR family NAD(P)-dependent oxidoreductase [Planctomycetota bacterium]
MSEAGSHGLTGRVCLVVGASGGIGTALVHRLARSAARVVIAGRHEGRLQALADATGATPVLGDATRGEDVARFVATATERFDRLDAVAHLPGSLHLKPAHLTTREEWDHTIATNLTSAYEVLRASVPALRSSRGSLVFIATAAARIGLPNHEAIAAAKAGLIGMCRSAAASYARAGIRVNVVAPGLVETPLTERITANGPAATASEAMHPLGRWGQPDEVASAIEWFLDPAQSWVTGQVLGVDGGLANLKTKGV